MFYRTWEHMFFHVLCSCLQKLEHKNQLCRNFYINTDQNVDSILRINSKLKIFVTCLLVFYSFHREFVFSKRKLQKIIPKQADLGVFLTPFRPRHFSCFFMCVLGHSAKSHVCSTPWFFQNSQTLIFGSSCK